MVSQSPLPRSVPTWPQFPRHLGVISLPPFTSLWSLWAASEEQELGLRPGSAETFSWKDTLVLSYTGPGSTDKTAKLQPIKGFAHRKWQARVWAVPGCMHARTWIPPSAPHSPLTVQRSNRTQSHPRPAFFTSPRHPPLDWAFSSEKWVPKPWSLLSDLPRTLPPHGLSGCSQPQESEGGRGRKS